MSYLLYLNKSREKGIPISFTLVRPNQREWLKVLLRLGGLCLSLLAGWKLSEILALGEEYSWPGFFAGLSLVASLFALIIKKVGRSYEPAGTLRFTESELVAEVAGTQARTIEFLKIDRTVTTFGISATGAYRRQPLRDALTIYFTIRLRNGEKISLEVLNESTHSVAPFAYLVTTELDSYVRYMKIRKFREKAGL